MIETIKFLLSLVIQLIQKLYSIDIGPMSLGTLFSIIYILFPILLIISTALKHQIVSDIRSDINEEKTQRRKKKK